MAELPRRLAGPEPGWAESTDVVVVGSGVAGLTCALHLSRFDLTNGEPLDPPAEEPLAVYPVVVDGGRIMIEVPDGPLEISE